MKKIIVKAEEGTRCPKEKNPRQYVSDSKTGTTVDDSPYYRRLIRDGSLVEVIAPQKTKKRSNK